jgi:3-oxoacyl-[acyl-carrier protein] reductase
MSVLRGKVAIVTGASQGIGRAIAERLARDGAAVALSFIADSESADSIVQSIKLAGGRAIAIEGDLRHPKTACMIFDEVDKQLGQPDIVVANAGVNMNKAIVDTTEEDFEQIFSVNARGTFFVLREASRRVRNGGRIIAISTNMTIQPRPGIALYAASKAAVEQFVKILARELGSRMISVNAVAPGPTDTDMVSRLSRETAPGSTPFGRLGRPEEIARVVAFLASDDAGWINGQIIGANGGLA